MDGMRFRSLCANVDRLSVGQLRELRRKLRELDAGREVLTRIDARRQALEFCVHCGASALVRWGSTRTGLQRLRCKVCLRTFSAATGHGGGAGPAAREAAAGPGGLPHYRLDATRGPRVIQAAFHIQTVNNMHSRFTAFMRPFCGPATNNLPAYIAWFIARLADEHTAQNHAWQQILAA